MSTTPRYVSEKAVRRRKNAKIKINGKETQIVKKFKYLGYEMRENNKEND